MPTNSDIVASLSWDEIVSKYPDKWIAFSDADFVKSDIQSGVIYAILDDDNVTDFYESHYDNIVYLTRTTEGQEASYIHGELIEA